MTDPWRQVQPYIRPGERVYWVGVPDPAVHFAPADGFLIPLSIAWCGFAFFWEIDAVGSGAPVFFAVWGLMFVVIGLYFVAGRFFYKARMKRRTVYALTDQRAIVSNSRTVADSPLLYQPVAVRTSGDGRHATVTVGNSGGNWMRPQTMYGNTGMELFHRGSMPFAFYDVADPRPMLMALEQARQPPPPPRSSGA